MHLLKSLKVWSILVVGIAVALFASGANSPAAPRPPGIEAAAWLPISESAGVAIARNESGGRVAGRLFAKKGDRWVEVFVENSAAAIPVTR